MRDDWELALALEDARYKLAEKDALIAKMQRVVDAAKALELTCRQTGWTVEYIVEGGLLGQQQKQIMKISLLDNISAALHALEEPQLSSKD